MKQLGVLVRQWFVSCLLALLVGTVSGLAASSFLKLLDVSVRSFSSIPWYCLFMPPAFFTARFLSDRFGHEPGQGGNERFLTAIQSASRSIQPVAVRLAAAVLTIASGGSAGRAGPSAQTGAASAALISGLLHLEPHRRRLAVLCGIAGGFAAVLGAPIAGTFLTMEIMRLKKKQYPWGFFLLISSFCSWIISRYLGVSHHGMELQVQESLGVLLILQALLGGVLFALIGILLMWSLRITRIGFEKIPLPAPWRAAAGGGLLVLFAFAVSPDYLGLGFSQVDSFLSGGGTDPVGFFYKIAASSVTLGSGAAGGIISPILFTGASAGSAFGQVVGADTGMFAALGMIGVLSACANAPIASVLLAAELFGVGILPAAVCSAGMSYLVTRTKYVPSDVLLFFPREK